jgi:hypothetical protein
MSTLPISPQPTTPGNISDVVSPQDLTTWAQIAGVLRYLTAPLNPPPAPSSGYTGSPQVTNSVFLNTYAALSSAGVDVAPAYLESAKHAAAAGNIGWAAAAIIAFFALWLSKGLNILLEALDAVRKGIDPSVANLSVAVLNEFLGTDFGAQNLPLGLGTGDHLARGQAIGQLLMGQLESEFANGYVTGQGSIAAAQTFAGVSINFGLASAIMGVIGGAIPFGMHMEELRELGEEVAKNIGLGRLVRRGLQPLVKILVSDPAEWYYNTKYLPTQFGIGDIVNPYTSSLMSTPAIFTAMNLLGYSNDKIQELIQLHQKKISPADVELLINNGLWAQTDGTNYTARDGWPSGFAGTVLQLEVLREVQKYVDATVVQAEDEVKAGKMTIDEFTQLVNGLPYNQTVKAAIVALTNYKVAAHVGRPHYFLSDGQLAIAFEAGLVTIDDLTTRWAAQGATQSDIQIKTALLLLKLNRLEDVEKQKEQIYAYKQTQYAAAGAPAEKVTSPPTAPIPPFPLGS